MAKPDTKRKILHDISYIKKLIKRFRCKEIANKTDLQKPEAGWAEDTKH